MGVGVRAESKVKARVWTEAFARVCERAKVRVGGGHWT
jgi:hypothetical protein